MKRRRDKRSNPRDVIREVGQVENDLVQFIRADASGELPAGSSITINMLQALIPLPLDSAIAHIRRLRQEILDQSHALCDLLAEAFNVGNRGQLAAAIESEAGEPRGEIAAELCQIIRDLELTLPQLEASLECLRKCSTLHRAMAAELNPQERRAFKEAAKRLREQTGE
jgi:hypothetical protein